ncbi:hypothetical protein VIBNIMADA3020_1130031 [Vibrio nigripulchritudo MADA3020]|nr:hypothetical protein VIBNIMADA3020_1130031 [Vibrio nigripulchritudo MADA3020]CCN52595.1 hypothetical protein VIBNIMADA3021_1290019 [Vibrio nigripulchritudo MADA3021]
MRKRFLHIARLNGVRYHRAATRRRSRLNIRRGIARISSSVTSRQCHDYKKRCRYMFKGIFTNKFHCSALIQFDGHEGIWGVKKRQLGSLNSAMQFVYQ